MSIVELLDRCHAGGLHLHMDGDRIRLRSDSGAPDPGLLEALRESKDAIVAYLRERARSSAFPCACCGQFFFPEPSVVCYWCRPPLTTPASSTHGSGEVTA